MLFKIDDILSTEYTIKEIIGEDHFGEYYRATDYFGKNYYLHIIDVDHDSRYKTNLDNYKNIINDYNNNSNYDEYLIKFKSSYTEKFNAKYLLITVYKYDFFKESLSKKLGWDEDNLIINNLYEENYYIPKLLNLLLFIKELKDQNSVFSYFSFFNSFIKDDRLVFTMPAFINLLDEVEYLNIKAVYNEFKDLNVFQLAPELIKNKENLSYKSDIWSFGILLSYLLIGKLPFYFKSEAEYIENIRKQFFELDFQEIPERWQHIIGGCLKINPDHRIEIDELIELFKNSIDSNNEDYVIDFSHQNKIENWYEFNQQSIVLNEFSEKKEIELKIKPKLIINRDTNIDVGKIAKLILSSNTIASNNNYRYEIALLPRPRIEILEKECELNKLEGVDNKWEGKLYFKLLNSKICIVDKKIKIDNKEFQLENNESIDNTIIVPSKKYCYSIKIEENLIINSPISTQISFKLLNRKEEIKQACTLIPRDYCKISIQELEGGQSLRALKGINNEIKLKLKYSNFNTILIEAIYIENKPEFVDLSFNSKNLTEMVLLINALDSSRSFSATFVIRYKEKILGELFDKEKTFNFTVELVERDIVAGSTVAIDFGTTNSCVVVKDRNLEPKIIELNEAAYENSYEHDKESIPSCIVYKSKDEYSIGLIAKKLLFEQGERNAFYSIKTAIGKNINALLMFDNSQPIEKSFESIAKDYIDKLIKNLIIKSRINYNNFVFTHPTKLENKSLKVFKKIVKEVVRKYQPNCSKIEFYDEATSAAMGVLENFAQENSSVLVYDFGGGTTDIVYANISSNIELDPLTDEEIVNYYIVPKKFRGYQIGGDDINRIIIESIIELAYSRKNVIIPFVNVYDAKPNKWNMESIIKVNFNIGYLWEFSEKIKRNIWDEEIKANLVYICTEGVFNNPETWKIQSDEIPAFNLKEIFSETDSGEFNFNDFRKAIFTQVYDKIKICIAATTSIISSAMDLDDKKNITLVLTGKASQFPLVKDVFYYYKGEIDESEFKLKYNFLPDDCFFNFDNTKIETRLNSEKLKSVVAQGAYKLFANKNINIQNILTYDVFVNTTKIEEGSIKINNGELTTIIKSNCKTHAVFYKKFNENVSAPLRVYSKTIYGNDVEYLNVHVSFNQNEAFSVYIDTNDSIHFVKYDKNFVEIENKVVNA